MFVILMGRQIRCVCVCVCVFGFVSLCVVCESVLESVFVPVSVLEERNGRGGDVSRNFACNSRSATLLTKFLLLPEFFTP